MNTKGYEWTRMGPIKVRMYVITRTDAASRRRNGFTRGSQLIARSFSVSRKDAATPRRNGY